MQKRAVGAPSETQADREKRRLPGVIITTPPCNSPNVSLSLSQAVTAAAALSYAPTNTPAARRENGRSATAVIISDAKV